MNVFGRIYKRAKRSTKTIALPEGDDIRVVQAALRAHQANLAKIVLLGKKEAIFKKVKKKYSPLSKLEVIDPQTDHKRDEYINAYWQLRQHKGVIEEAARELLLKDYVFYAAMMLREGRIDGFAAGANHTTSDVVRAALHCLKRDERYKVASGAFLVEIKDKAFGKDGLFLFADCGIIPTPTADQLADIACTSADLWVRVTGYKPRVAMLSFSTKGSGSAISVKRIREAVGIAKKARPDLIIDGELQVDSAVVPAVAKIKSPGSILKGRANILIFPSLDAGNISYKLMQRLAGARVVGPIIQGLSKPCSDLSRGCGLREIIDAIVVTAVRAQ
ncbi:MAG: phosphate acetyltransferase [Candidatus Omnitrophica bacterium]|nr:phosphate acetyltransferase [Candidatus Omnitrophota bacterium]